MLMNLPKDRKKVFLYKNSQTAGKTLRAMRKNATHKLGIKELRKITLYTFRYWRATVEFQEYKTEVAVMVLLGHKTTAYLWLYVQLAHIYFRGAPKKYISLWVTTREEESKAIEDGFDFVRTATDGEASTESRNNSSNHDRTRMKTEKQNNTTFNFEIWQATESRCNRRHLSIDHKKPFMCGRSLVWSRTSACHADDPGSNLGDRTKILTVLISVISTLFRIDKDNSNNHNYYQVRNSLICRP